MVGGIHTSLDQNTYRLIDMSKVDKEEVVVVLEKEKVITNSMTWRTEQPAQTVWQGPQDILKNPAGVKLE